MSRSGMVLRFVTEPGVGAAVIRWFSHGGSCMAFSHVDLILPDSGDALGARSDHPVNGKTGVQIRPARYAEFSRCLTIEVPMPAYCADAGYAWARTQIGRPYDMTGLFANFLFDRDWRDPQAWWCSEYIFVALEEAHFWATLGCGHRKLPAEQNRITPSDLLLLLSPFYRVLDATN